MWELDSRESWVPKNCHFQTVVLEKTLESPLDSKEIKPVNPKRNQSWIFIGPVSNLASPLAILPSGSWCLEWKDSLYPGVWRLLFFTVHIYSGSFLNNNGNSTNNWLQFFNLIIFLPHCWLCHVNLTVVLQCRYLLFQSNLGHSQRL